MYKGYNYKGKSRLSVDIYSYFKQHLKEDTMLCHFLHIIYSVYFINGCQYFTLF